MKMKKLGKSNVSISEIIFGTWVMGDDEYWGSANELESIKAIRTAWEGGVTTFDTAYVYGYGKSEKLLGEAIKGLPREEMSIITKLWRTEMAKDLVAPACEGSLKALGLDYIDVYFIHYPSNSGVPIGETMEALMKLKSQGKIKSIGVSNFSLEQLKQARQYGEIDSIQPCYSLVWRFLDGPELEYCRENDIGIVPYSPLAQGILTGKYQCSTTFPKEDGRSQAPLFQQPYFDGALKVTDVLKHYAKKYDKTPAQVAIRWLIQTPGITAPIVGGRSCAQVAENLKAIGWKLSEEDYQAIDKISREFTQMLPSFRNFFDATILSQ
ncbi:MAG TPA: aldo/keto reductase [Clostridiales bacterium]|nr:aldo/keto reductase [Clostridiales bacterium]